MALKKNTLFNFNEMTHLLTVDYHCPMYTQQISELKTNEYVIKRKGKPNPLEYA
jgi:hypothetical protein